MHFRWECILFFAWGILLISIDALDILDTLDILDILDILDCLNLTFSKTRQSLLPFLCGRAPRGGGARF